MKEVTRESDVDVVLAFESFEAMHDFEYDGLGPKNECEHLLTHELSVISSERMLSGL